MLHLVSESKIRTFEFEFHRIVIEKLGETFDVHIMGEKELEEDQQGNIIAPKTKQQFVLFAANITEILYPITASQMLCRLQNEGKRIFKDWAKGHKSKNLILAESPKAWLQKIGPSIVGGVYAAVGHETRRKRRRT